MAQTLAQSLTATIAVTLAATRAVGAANGDRVLDPGEGLAHGCHRRRDTLHLRERVYRPTRWIVTNLAGQISRCPPTFLVHATRVPERARDAALHVA